MVGCEVMLCDSKGLCDVVDWKLMCFNYAERMSEYYGPVLQSIIPYYYKVLLHTTKCYAVLDSTTKYCITPYYKELLRTTK